MDLKPFSAGPRWRLCCLALLVLYVGCIDAQAQPYTHIAPHMVGGTASLSGALFRTYASVGLTVAGQVENTSQTRMMAFGPWSIYTLMRQGDTGTLVDLLDVPASFHLDQNYPNPFNPATTLRFSVPEPVHARLIVYDTLGRTVTVLVDERLAPGIYTIPFHGRGLPSGLYLYHLDAGVYHAARTMLLLK